MFLSGPTKLKKKFSFYFYFNCVLFKKLEGDRLMTQQKIQFLLGVSKKTKKPIKPRKK
jgi:hypothetical protein